jgi:transcriptional regulator with XRE-family HTH domain
MLGVTLKNRREQLGLTVQDIARMTGMLPKQVVALEADDGLYFVGGKLEIERLTKLYAKKINVTLDNALWANASADNSVVDQSSLDATIPAFLMAAAPADAARPVNVKISADQIKPD